MSTLVSVPFRGRAQGRAQGRRNVTRTWGGVSQKRRGECHIPPFHFPLSPFGYFVLDRTTRAAPAGRGRRERPPLFDRWRGQSRGGVSQPPSQPASHPLVFGEVAPVLCIPAGRLPGPRAGRTIRPTERPHA